MGTLIPRLIIAGLGAAVSPVAVIMLIAVMMKRHPVRNALLFLAAFTLTLVVLGTAMVLVFHVGGSGKRPVLDACIDLALAALCLALLIVAMRRKRKPPKELVGDRELRASRAFALGCAAMLPNASTLVIYSAGLHAISETSGLGWFNKVLSVALLTLLSLLSLIVPIIAYVAFPKSADRVLASLRTWLSRHQRLIGEIVLLTFAILLLLKGIMRLT